MILKIKFKKKEAFEALYQIISYSIKSANTFIVECDTVHDTQISTDFRSISTMVSRMVDDKGNCIPGSYMFKARFKVDKLDGVYVDRYIYDHVVRLKVTARTATLSYEICDVDYIKHAAPITLKGAALPFPTPLLCTQQQIHLN